MNRSAAILLITQFASILLLVSSLEHLVNPFRFLDGVLQYKLLPFELARLIAATLPMITLVAGTAVLVPSLRRPGLLLVGMLGVIFTSLQLTAILRELSISCGCFDPFRSSEISWKSVLLPLTLALGGFAGLFLESHRSEGPSNA